MLRRSIVCLTLLVLLIALVPLPEAKAQEEFAPVPVYLDAFVAQFNALLTATSGVSHKTKMKPLQLSIVEEDERRRTVFLLEGVLPDGIGITVEGLAQGELVIAYAFEFEHHNSREALLVQLLLAGALLPLEYSANTRVEDLQILAEKLLDIYPPEGRKLMERAYEELYWDNNSDPNMLSLMQGWIGDSSEIINGYKLVVEPSEREGFSWFVATLLTEPDLLAEEPVDPALYASAESLLAPLDDEELAYFTLSNETAYAGGDLEWLTFVENGIPRFMLCYLGDDGIFYDYFNNRKAFKLSGNSSSNSINIPWVGSEAYKEAEASQNALIMGVLKQLNPSTEMSELPVEGGEAVYFENSFPQGTVIRWLRSDYQNLEWFSANNPRQTGDYDMRRDYYRLAYSRDQRFPRSADFPRDNPESPIPRGRDSEPVSNLSNIGLVTIRYQLHSKDWAEHEVHFFVRQVGDKVCDLFTGEWLYTYNETTDQMSENDAFLDSLRPGYHRSEHRPYFRSFQGIVDSSRRFTPENNNTDSLSQYGLYYEQAKTVGDLRRIYEMLPKSVWYMLPDATGKEAAAYAEGSAGTHLVRDEVQLRDALEKAKRGDTIVLLNDVFIHSPLRLKGKRLTFMGAPDTQPTLKLYDCGFNHWNPSFKEDVLIIEGGRLQISNLRISADGTGNGIHLSDGGGVVLGENAVVENCYWIAKIQEKSRLTIDGALIQNCGSLFMNGGKLHMKSGEITGNHADFGSLIEVSGAEFLMEGGSIHHNGHSETTPPEATINLKDSNMMMKGGEIFENWGSTCGGIMLEQGQLTMEGGTIRDNSGLNAGGVYLIYRKARALMKDGLIANNRNFNNRGAGNVYISAYEKSSFDMKGGSLMLSNDRLELRGIRNVTVDGKGNTFTFSAGDITPLLFREVDGGKFIDKNKKK